MDKKDYMDEQLNIRCFYLRLLKRIWFVPLFAVAGAVAGFLLYGAVTRVTQPVLYEAKAQLYLHFVENATNDKVYDYYNAYTWNDLLKSDTVQSLLRESAEQAVAVSSFPEGGAFTNETGRENMSAVCMRMYEEGTLTMTAIQPSDIRVLWITVQSEEPDCAGWFMNIAWRAMLRYGEENDVFRSIELLSQEEPVPVTYPDRLRTAMVTGAVLGALLGLFLLAILDLLDDAVYVPEDAEKRYGLPVVAVTGDDALPELLRKEADRCFEQLRAEGKTPVILTPDTTEEERAGADVLLLGVASGKKNTSLTQHVLSQARARGEQVEGIVLTDADGTFLQRYYKV